MLVRSTGPDIVVRYAGRRLRVGSEWCEVVAEALARLRSEAGDRLEEKLPVALEVPRVEELQGAETDDGGKAEASAKPQSRPKTTQKKTKASEEE